MVRADVEKRAVSRQAAAVLLAGDGCLRGARLPRLGRAPGAGAGDARDRDPDLSARPALDRRAGRLLGSAPTGRLAGLSRHGPAAVARWAADLLGDAGAVRAP